MLAGVFLALSIWPFASHPKAPPPPLGPLPSTVEMTTIADSAVGYAKVENEEVGMPGLTSDVKTCYSTLGANPMPAKVAYCIILDTAASKIAYAGGEIFAPDYFRDEPRAKRELRLEQKVTTPDNRRVFVQAMDEAEILAEDAVH